MKKYWYVASPYSRYGGGLQAAAEHAAACVAVLMNNGYAAISPIVHGHEVKKFAALPETHAFWLNMDRVLLEQAFGVIVCQLPGWKDSVGVNWEQGEAARLNMPVLGMSPVAEGSALQLPYGIEGFKKETNIFYKE